MLIVMELILVWINEAEFKYFNYEVWQTSSLCTLVLPRLKIVQVIV